MTHFKIVCPGWQNWPWIKQTLMSIEMQNYRDYDVCVVDDASGSAPLSNFITAFCDAHGWNHILQTEHKGPLFNQVAGIRLMNPDPEDVIVFLDADGDRLAHCDVLANLDRAYQDGSRLVYSTYDTEPESLTSIRSRPYPDNVITTNRYREFTRSHGIYWNHLRTFKAEIFYNMTESDWQDENGEWFQMASDSAMMFPALELARGKVKFHDEVMLIYRADHTLSEWKRWPGGVIDHANDIILNRNPKW